MYHRLLKLDVDHASSTTSDRKCSDTTNIFRSIDMLIARIFLVSGSIIATQSQMYLEHDF